MATFIRRASVQDLKNSLRTPEPIVYTNNGNRSSHVKKTLRKARPLLQSIGVTRVSDISQLAYDQFPVFQSTRPNSQFHTRSGMNSGAQGKGTTNDQARISCYMETIENFCLEYREVHAIRGSYDEIRRNQIIAPPQGFLHSLNVKPAQNNEPLMWYPALSVELNAPALVPAEAVFCFFIANNYLTRSLYVMGSNGLAAGATCLEAANHGLLEVIERHYLALDEAGITHASGLFENEFSIPIISDFIQNIDDDFELQLYAIQIPGAPNIPMIKCILANSHEISLGFGCCLDVNMAACRAITEALQSYATRISGSREDITATALPRSQKKRPHTLANYPSKRTLSPQDYGRMVTQKRFRDLRQEFNFLVAWIHQWGFPHVYIANLAFEKMPVAVLKVLVPGMFGPRGSPVANFSERDFNKIKYAIS